MNLNPFLQILGAMMLAAAFYICFNEDFREYTYDLGMKHYMSGVYILIVAGCLVMIQSFFGVCGAYLKKNGMLNIVSDINSSEGLPPLSLRSRLVSF